jgi:hypothetical protein
MPSIGGDTMKTKKLGTAVGLALTLSVIGMTSHEARASECGMGDDIDWYAGERAKVSTADSLLESGQAREAAWMVQTTWPRMREARPVTGSLPHIAEAVRVMALACVRTEGNVRGGLGWSGATAEERAANVRWGVSRLRMLAEANPESAPAKADLGEGLALSPKTEDEARAILEGLDAAHNITSVEAFSALARLRFASGDKDGAALALAECDSLTLAFDRCTVSPPDAMPVLTASK